MHSTTTAFIGGNLDAVFGFQPPEGVAAGEEPVRAANVAVQAAYVAV